MKANELMLGDYVTFKACLKNGEIIPVKIVEIRSYNKDALVEIDGDKACYLIEIDDEIVGIPLTPEILEKNGFENVGQNVYQIEKGSFWVWWESDRCRLGVDVDESSQIEENFGEVLRLPVVYVHKLQHALKLCKIEKEIIL